MVGLSVGEYKHWVHEGVDRRLRDKLAGKTARYGDPKGDLWDIDIQGILAEYAFAKWLGVPFDPVKHPDRVNGDVAGFEVRSTPRPNGCLLLHEGDPDDRAFVLLCGRDMRWDVKGWCLAAFGKQQRWWREGDEKKGIRPCYFVPQRFLFPMQDLRAVAA